MDTVTLSVAFLTKGSPTPIFTAYYTLTLVGFAWTWKLIRF